MGMLVLALAAVLGLAAIDVAMARRGRDVPFAGWIRSWSERQVTVTDNDDGSRTRRETTLGNETMSYLIWGSGGAALAGLGLLLVKPRGRRRSR